MKTKITFSLLLFSCLIQTPSFAKGYSSCGKLGEGFSATNIAVNNALINSIYGRYHDGSTPVCYHSGIGGSFIEVHAYENKTAAKYSIWDNGVSTVTLILNQSTGVKYCEYKLNEKNNEILEDLPSNSLPFCANFTDKLFQNDKPRYEAMVKILKGLNETWELANLSLNKQASPVNLVTKAQPLKDNTLSPISTRTIADDLTTQLIQKIRSFQDLM